MRNILGKIERERERVKRPLKSKLKIFKVLTLVGFAFGAFFLFSDGAQATTYYVSSSGSDTNNGTSTSTPWKTLSKAYLTNVNDGDTIALKRGDVWYEGLEIYYGGSPGNPVMWTAYGTGEQPIIKGSNLADSWTQAGNNWFISYGGQVAGGGTENAYGVWEDGAPLFSVAALADIRPGTFFWDSGTLRLYVRTYESDAPSNHIMEHSRYWYPSASAISIADSSGGVATDYLVIENIRAEKGRSAGISIIASAHAKNSITLQNMTITQNFTGVIYSGTYAQTITINNSTIWGNAYSAVGAYNTGANSATVNITNSTIGGTLFFTTFNPGSGGTINVDRSIISGNLAGRYFLTHVNTGTLNITNTSYKNPRFIQAGGNGLGVATFNSDDTEGTGYHRSLANIFNERGLKYTWNITSKLDLNQWSEVNDVLAANQIIGVHTRNHNQMSSSPGGNDIVNAFAVNYTGGTTVTASYIDPIFTLSVDGVTTNINVSTENAKTCGSGTYDTTYLGNATYGLIGCINALSVNYTSAYPTTASASILRTGGAIYVSSRVLSDQTNVNIKSPNCSTTVGCIALDATRYYNSEIFTVGQRDGEYADWDVQSGSIAGYTTTSFAWPFENWSLAGIARLYEKGIKIAFGGDTINSMTVARRLLFNQLYPLNLPIAAPYASDLQMTMDTSQNGTDEAWNTAATLDTYPVMHLMFSHYPSEASLDAVTSYIDTLRTEGITIMDTAAAIALNEGSGGVLDTASYTTTRKIIPTFNFILKIDSPAIDSGTPISGLTTDQAGNPIYGTPDIGSYEYQPPYTFSANDIPTTGSVRLYSDGQYRMLTATSSSATANFSVIPSSGSYLASTTQYMDIQIDSWLTTGTKNKQWTASSTSGTFATLATSTLYTIGDLAPNKYYQFKLDGAASSTAIIGYGSTSCTDGVCLADSNGQIQFVYSGGYSSHTFGLEQNAPTNVGISSITANSTSQITIVAQTATDTDPGLHSSPYWFNETTGGSGASDSSDWQASTSFVDSGLSANTQYTYQVKARDGNSNESSYSTATSTYTLAPTPTNLSGTAGQTTMDLSVGSFTNATVGSSGYYFSRSGANSGWIQTNSWTESGLSCNNSYTYSVKYRNGDGTETSEISTTKSTNGCGGGGGSPAIWTLPAVPAGGFKININGGTSITSNRNVILGFNAGTDIKKVSISMTGDFTDASQEDYVTFKQWDLCSKLGGAVKNPTCPDGTYTVYAKFYTVYGRSSDVATVSSSITLDFNAINPPTEVITSTNQQNQDQQPFTKPLRYGMTDADVKRLQIFLNQEPDTRLDNKWVGSPGKETNYFGPKTWVAVRRFQEKYGKDILSPWGLIRGTGYVGKTTLAKINELISKITGR